MHHVPDDYRSSGPIGPENSTHSVPGLLSWLRASFRVLAFVALHGKQCFVLVDMRATEEPCELIPIDTEAFAEGSKSILARNDHGETQVARIERYCGASLLVKRSGEGEQ